jgi:hypothetical protein
MTATSGTTTWQNKGDGRHNNGKGQYGDMRQDDGDRRQHSNGKGQQGDGRHDDGNSRYDDR